jgi:hypothetical protein
MFQVAADPRIVDGRERREERRVRASGEVVEEVLASDGRRWR